MQRENLEKRLLEHRQMLDVLVQKARELEQHIYAMRGAAEEIEFWLGQLPKEQADEKSD
jgi:hypothetical protein